MSSTGNRSSRGWRACLHQTGTHRQRSGRDRAAGARQADCSHGWPAGARSATIPGRARTRGASSFRPCSPATGSTSCGRSSIPARSGSRSQGFQLDGAPRSLRRQFVSTRSCASPFSWLGPRLATQVWFIAPRVVRTDGRGREAIRVGIVCDLREEGWHSMDLIADMLLTTLPAVRVAEVERDAAPAADDPPVEPAAARRGQQPRAASPTV